MLTSRAALCSFLVLLAAAGTAAADGAKTLGIDGGLALPTGDWGDAAGVGIGALARFEMPLRPKLTLTARAGYLQHLSKENNGADSSSSELPLLGGVRYDFSGDDNAQLYGGAELGFIMSRISIDVNGQSMSDSDTNLGMTLGGGYRTGKLDLRANLLFPDVGELGDVMGLMATLGYHLTTL
jgi:opacity protein-like surface antigen